MRTPTLLLALALAAGTATLLPSAQAATQACTIVTSSGCGGWVCASRDTDGRWSDAECVSKSDLDRCQLQSDCCSATGFWCPEDDRPLPAGACTDAVDSRCEGYVCVDRDLNGAYGWNECEPRYCTCDPQPTPW